MYLYFKEQFMEIHLWSFHFPNVDIVTVTDDIDIVAELTLSSVDDGWEEIGDDRASSWNVSITVFSGGHHSTACYTCTETESLLGNMVLCSGSLVYALKNIWQLAKNICWYPRSCSGCGCVLMLEIWTLAANCPSWGGGWPVWCRCPGPALRSANHGPGRSCQRRLDQSQAGRKLLCFWSRSTTNTGGTIGPYTLHITHHLLEVGWGNYDRYDWSFI